MARAIEATQPLDAWLGYAPWRLAWGDATLRFNGAGLSYGAGEVPSTAVAQYNYLVRIYWGEHVLCFWDGSGDISLSIDGDTQIATGSNVLQDIGLPQMGASLDAAGVSISLALDHADLREALAGHRPAHVIGQVFMLPRIAGDFCGADGDFPLRIFQGVLDVSEHNYGEASAEIVMQFKTQYYASGARGHASPYMTAASFKAIDPDDKAGAFLPGLKDQATLGKWGKPNPPARERKRKKSIMQAGFAGSMAFIANMSNPAGWVAYAAAAVSAGLSYHSAEKQRKAYNEAARDAAAVDRRPDVVADENKPALRFVFGRSIAGGDLLYRALFEEEYVNQIICLAAHPIDGVEELLIGNSHYGFVSGLSEENPITAITIEDGASDYADLIHYATRLDGTSELDYAGWDVEQITNAALAGDEVIYDTDNISGLIADWTSEHKAVGKALLAVRAKYNIDRIVPYSNFRFILRGGRFYDPRRRETSYTANAALVIAGYIHEVLGWRYGDDTTTGTQRQAGGIDIAALMRSADICDALDFELHGTVFYDEEPQSVLAKFATHIGGRIIFNGWDWLIKAGDAEAATLTISNNDVGGVNYQPDIAGSESFNAVTGSYANDPDHPDSNRMAQSDYDVVENSDAQSLDGVTQTANIDYMFSGGLNRARKLASMALAANRNARKLKLELVRRKAFVLTPGDRVMVDLSIDEAISGMFRVGDMLLNESGVWEMTLIGDPDEIYTQAPLQIGGVGDVGDIGSDSLAPAPPLLAVLVDGALGGDVAPDGTAINDLELRFATNAGAHSGNRVQVQLRRVGAAAWSDVASVPAHENRVSLGFRAVGISFEARCRVVNVLGAGSDWLVSAPFSLPPDAEAPDAPANVTASLIGESQMRLEIAPVTADDLAGFDVRFMKAPLSVVPPKITSEAAWQAAELLQIPASLPAREADGDHIIFAGLLESGEYRFYVRARDRTGNLSPLSENASAKLRFISTAGILESNDYGGVNGWDNVVAMHGFVPSSTGKLLPLAGRSGAQADQLARAADKQAIWHNTPWLMAPPADVQGEVILASGDLGGLVSGMLNLSVDIWDAPDNTIGENEAIIYHIRTKQTAEAAYSEWVDMDGASYELRDVRFCEVKLGFINLGVRQINLSVTTRATSYGSSASIGDAQNGVAIAFLQPFFQPPFVQAYVTAVNAAGELDDYEVTGQGTATTSGVTLYMRHRESKQRATGTIAWVVQGNIV